MPRQKKRELKQAFQRIENRYMMYNEINTRADAMTKVNVKWLTQFMSIAAVAVVLPFFIHLQWITGPIINALLILAVIITGVRSAMLIALIPSMIALGSGLLPAILAPAVPFIMIVNTILVLSVDWFWRNRKNDQFAYWQGVIIGAALKFLLLFFSINLIAKLLIKQELATVIAQMMSWTQFATAIAGGIIAWLILKFLKFLK